MHRTGAGSGPRRERKKSGVGVNMGDSVDNFTEIVWCNHLDVHRNVVVVSDVPNIFVTSSKFYIVAEQGKVKMLCRECFIKGFIKFSQH